MKRHKIRSLLTNYVLSQVRGLSEKNRYVNHQISLVLNNRKIIDKCTLINGNIAAKLSIISEYDPQFN